MAIEVIDETFSIGIDTRKKYLALSLERYKRQSQEKNKQA